MTRCWRRSARPCQIHPIFQQDAKAESALTHFYTHPEGLVSGARWRTATPPRARTAALSEQRKRAGILLAYDLSFAAFELAVLHADAGERVAAWGGQQPFSPAFRNDQDA